MRIRIGMGLGTDTELNDERFAPACQRMEQLGFDSLWVSERLGGSCPDPLVAMAVAAGATTRLKFGMSVMVLPGRNPVVTAKALASLDRMSGGRLLPAFGLGAADPLEQQAFGVSRSERGPWLEEALPLVRQLWTGEPVEGVGSRFEAEGVRIAPRPVGRMEVWLGGDAPRALERVGRLADGWLPSFITPARAARGWQRINETAQANGRALDADHFGVLVPYCRGPLPDRIRRLVATRHPELEAEELVASGLESLADRLGAFIEVGASKFVVVAVSEPADHLDELEAVAEAVLHLQD